MKLTNYSIKKQKFITDCFYPSKLKSYSGWLDWVIGTCCRFLFWEETCYKSFQVITNVCRHLHEADERFNLCCWRKYWWNASRKIVCPFFRWVEVGSDSLLRRVCHFFCQWLWKLQDFLNRVLGFRPKVSRFQSDFPLFTFSVSIYKVICFSLSFLPWRGTCHFAYGIIIQANYINIAIHATFILQLSLIKIGENNYHPLVRVGHRKLQ